MNFDFLNELTSVKRISLFGKLIEQENKRLEEIEMKKIKQIDSTAPSQEVLDNNYAPTHTENEEHLATIFCDSEDVMI